MLLFKNLNIACHHYSTNDGVFGVPADPLTVTAVPIMPTTKETNDPSSPAQSSEDTTPASAPQSPTHSSPWDSPSPESLSLSDSSSVGSYSTPPPQAALEDAATMDGKIVAASLSNLLKTVVCIML